MKKQGEFYVVEVSCNKENAVELVEWLQTHEQKLDRIESTLASEDMTLSQLVEKLHEHSGTNGFLMEINFRNEEVALLAEMKYSQPVRS